MQQPPGYNPPPYGSPYGAPGGPGAPQGYGAPPPYGYPPHPPPRPPDDPVRSNANLALGLSIGSVVVCCFPLGGIAAHFALRATKLAKERNVSTPTNAIIAFFLSGLSLLITVAGLGSYFWDLHRHQEREASLEHDTKGKLHDKELTPKIACELFEAQLLKGLYQGETLIDDVKCTGTYETHGDAATLPTVTFTTGGKSVVVRGCLARASRWLAIGQVPPGVTCPTEALESKLGKKASDAELEAEEDGFRKSFQAHADQAIVATFVEQLSRARKHVAADDYAPTSCKDVDVSDFSKGGTLKVHPVDGQFIDDPKGAEGWSFLTSDEMRAALDDGLESSKRAEAVRTIGREAGPFVVIYASRLRDLPKLVKQKTLTEEGGYLGGGFVGVLGVVDLRTGQAVCGAKLKFESSKTLKTDRFADDDEVKKALADDLSASYKSAAAAAIKGAGGRFAIVGAE